MGGGRVEQTLAFFVKTSFPPRFFLFFSFTKNNQVGIVIALRLCEYGAIFYPRGVADCGVSGCNGGVFESGFRERISRP